MATTFLLHPVPPFRLDLTVWVLRRESSNFIDQWDGEQYTRVFIINKKPIHVTITQENNRDNPQIVVVTKTKLTKKTQKILSSMIENMLGLRRDLSHFYLFAQNDRHLKPLVNQFMGVKPTCFPTFFEAFCNAIACQQLSLSVGIQLLNRLAQNFGQCIQEQQKNYCAFPLPEAIAQRTPAAFRELGFSVRKGETLIHIAKTLIKEKKLLTSIEKMSDDQAMNYLLSLKGIGRWSAEYVLLRGLGRIHIFPHNDVGAENNVKKFLHLEKSLNSQHMNTILANWHPYAGLIYFHLLLKAIHEKNILKNFR